MEKKDIFIFGSGGFASEVDWLIDEINRGTSGENTWDVKGFVVEDGNPLAGGEFCGKPVFPESKFNEFAEGSGSLAVAVGVGNPGVRKKIVQKLAGRKNIYFPVLIHPSVLYDRRPARISIGEGSILCGGVILTTNIKVGAHVHINLDSTVGHDTVIEDFVTISPGVHISGKVHIEEGAYLGTGCAIIEEKRIGCNSVIGAGAVVVRDIAPGVTAVGVPAKPL